MEEKEGREKAVVIVSGGMDSTTLLYDVVNRGFDTYALSFDYNQKHKKELKYAKRNCKRLNVLHKILKLKVLNEVAPSSLTRKEIDVPQGHYAEDNMKQTVVPNRNMVMLSLATSYAISIKAKYLFYGPHAGDHAIYPDCRKEFVEALAHAIELADWHKVKLVAPYLDMKKEDIVKIGKKIKVDIGGKKKKINYKLTWSCYEGKKEPCGKCGTCVERIEAFHNAGYVDPWFKNNWQDVVDNVEKVKKQYETKRDVQ
jgi:7-cyano-7-deazaguanine synthase